MRRFPWVSVALLIVLGLLVALTYPTIGDRSPEAKAEAAAGLGDLYAWVGGIAGALALVIGALGVWARAPATLPTALGIVAAGAFAAAWLAEMLAGGDAAGFQLGMVVAYAGVLVAFAASARRVAASAPDA